MTDRPADARTCVSRIIAAGPERLYAAFTDPAALAEWLPPGEMTGMIHAFDGREGGGYSMSLFYPEDDMSARGKTNDREDRAEVRFVALEPPHRIVEAVRFVSDDPGFQGEMTMAIGFEKVERGTEVTMLFENLPPGLSAADNELGSRQSLEQLARWVEKA